MNISVLIPTRGDRPRFLSNAIRMIGSQTVQPDHIEIMNDTPLDPIKKDITWRYRIGCQRILEKNPGTDAIIFLEDDDWYSPNYIECLSQSWDNSGRPLVYGVGDTIYYHLVMRGWYRMVHPLRASAMSTLLSADGARQMVWPADNFVFTDIEIWKKLSGKTFIPPDSISIGIKGYMEGALFGGIGHRRDLSQYKNHDKEFNWLRSKVDAESFNFYKQIAESIR